MVSATLVLAVAMAASACGGSGSGVTRGSPESSEIFNRSNWGTLDSDPGAHKGAHVSFVGKVFVSPERDKEGTYMQVWVDPKNSEWNTIVAYREPTFQVQDGDYVRVSGTAKGAYHGKNAFGADVVATTVLADTVKVVDATAAATPARTTLGRATYKHAGIAITIRKIEVAEDETRVFVTVHNGSAANVSVYGTSMKLVAGGKQLDSTFSIAGYPELSSDIVPGASTSGVVVFPKVASGAPLKLYVDAHSDDMSVGNYGSLTHIFSWK